MFVIHREQNGAQPLAGRAVRPRFRLVNLAALLGVFLVLATSLYPGRFDGDMSAIYAVVCPPIVHNWHLPMIAALLRLLTYVAPGPAPMFFVQLGLWFAGLALLTDRLILQGRPAAAIAISVLALFPPTAFEWVEIQKDVFLTALATLIAAHGLRSLTDANTGTTCAKAVKIGQMVWVSSLFVLAMDVRKNGFCLLVGLLFLFNPVNQLRWRPVLLKTASIILLLLATGISADLIDYSLLKAHRPHEISSLAVFDLAGVSALTGTDTSLGLLPDFAASAARCYTPKWWDPFLWGGCADVGRAADLLMGLPSSRDALLHAWMRAIAVHPVAYLEHRLSYFSCFTRIACPVRSTYPMMSGGISWSRPWEVTPYKPTRVGLILEHWSNASVASPLGSGALWLLGSMAMAAVASRQIWRQGYSPLSYFILVVSGSALFYTAMFAVGGVASALRYLHVTMVFCTIALPLSVSILLRPATKEETASTDGMQALTKPHQLAPPHSP